LNVGFAVRELKSTAPLDEVDVEACRFGPPDLEDRLPVVSKLFPVVSFFGIVCPLLLMSGLYYSKLVFMTIPRVDGPPVRSLTAPWANSCNSDMQLDDAGEPAS